MIGLYFSGTGNTEHCLRRLVSRINSEACIMPLEDLSALIAIKNCDEIFLAYPTQFSNMPYFVREFVESNASVWNGKRVFLMTTMGLFSGDGTGCAARLLKKYGAEILGGIQIRMPDSVCDKKTLKKPIQDNIEICKAADKRIDDAALLIKDGIFPQEGLSFTDHCAGLFGQRLWFYRKTTGYTDKLHIHDMCIGCGLCASICPTNNLAVENGKAVAGNRCTMCYRCISRCPQKAITLLGKKVVVPCSYNNYSDGL